MVSDTVKKVTGFTPMSIFPGWLMLTQRGKSLPRLPPVDRCSRTVECEEIENRKLNESSLLFSYSVLFLLPSVRWSVNRRLIPASTEKITRRQAQVRLVFHLLTPSRSESAPFHLHFSLGFDHVCQTLSSILFNSYVTRWKSHYFT